MKLDLTRKVVVVTGASGGIGQAIAREFLSEGCRVALIAREKQRLSKVASDLKKLLALRMFLIFRQIAQKKTMLKRQF